MTGLPNPQVALGKRVKYEIGDTLEAHDKQFLVFSSAGKPIYSYHGNEEKLSSFMATAEALMSVTTQSRGESLRYIRSGHCVVAFLDRSPLCLVAISNLTEPPAVLRMQLALVHGQLTSLLTASAVENIFAKSPGYDARRLLGGADIMLASLIDSFTTTPAALLGAFPSLPLPVSTRTAVTAAVRAALTSSNAAFGLLVSGASVAALAASGKQQLQQWDVLLLLNFLKSNASLRQTETFTPLCLPTYNPNGHLHAYIRFLDEETGTVLVLLAGGAIPDFQQLSAAQQELVRMLESSGALHTVKKAAREVSTAQCGYLGLETLNDALQKAGLGVGCALHCVYKKTTSQQYVASNWTDILDHDHVTRQEIIVAYSQMRASMFDHGGEHVQGSHTPLQTLRFESRQKYSLIALSSATFELYLVLDCLVGKAEAVQAGEEVLRTLTARQDSLFSSDSSEYRLFRSLYL